MEEFSATEARRRVHELVRRAQNGERFLIVYGRCREPIGILGPPGEKQSRNHTMKKKEND